MGGCYDNAVVGRFFATLEWELFAGADRPTRATARPAVVAYMAVWYNPQRRHSSLDDKSPIAYERRLTATAATGYTRCLPCREGHAEVAQAVHTC
jgi:putative transposase